MPSSASMLRSLPKSTLFPYTTLFRSAVGGVLLHRLHRPGVVEHVQAVHEDGLLDPLATGVIPVRQPVDDEVVLDRLAQVEGLDGDALDRKSTRLNSSHTVISYAVFCFNAPVTPQIYTLSLHDALPICSRWSASPSTAPTRGC